MADLSLEQRRTLHVLGYMLYRMGLHERAARVYDVLARPQAEDRPDAKACMGRAACLIAQGDGAEALKLLRSLTDGRVLSSAEAPLLLMKAQALWQLGREAESAAARDEYLYLVNGDRRL